MRDLGLQLRAAVFLAVTRLLLTRKGTTSTLRLLTRRSRGQGRPGQVALHRGSALRAVRRAGRVLGGTCLAQSVALTAVLEHAGQHPTLYLGCRPDDGSWSAHAWVVVGSEVLEPVRGGPHAELARLERQTDWVPTPVGGSTTGG